MSDGTYKYGTASTVEIVLGAVKEQVSELGRPVSIAEIKKHILAQVPNFLASNVGPDLAVLSVNNFARGNYSGNTTPRPARPARR